MRDSQIVTNDSFPAHAAQAFEIPATVLFGATSPYFGFAPKAPQIHVETLNLACSPCTRHGNRQCPYKNLKCLTGISANHVFKQILQKEKGNKFTRSMLHLPTEATYIKHEFQNSNSNNFKKSFFSRITGSEKATKKTEDTPKVYT